MENFVVKWIEKSIKTMDEFLYSDYKYMELDRWFLLVDKEDRKGNLLSTEGRARISLIISRKCRNTLLYECGLTMTKLRQMKDYRYVLERDCQEELEDEDKDFNNVICEACKSWKMNELILLDKEIILHAQNSFNRTDYGCEWTGRGMWTEHTLYGDTTDYYITGIILRSPLGQPELDAIQILKGYQKEIDQNDKVIEKAMQRLTAPGCIIRHRGYGKVEVVSREGKDLYVLFPMRNTKAKFLVPDALVEGHVSCDNFSEEERLELEALFQKNEKMKNMVKCIQDSANSKDYDRMQTCVFLAQHDILR